MDLCRRSKAVLQKQRRLDTRKDWGRQVGNAATVGNAAGFPQMTPATGEAGVEMGVLARRNYHKCLIKYNVTLRPIASMTVLPCAYSLPRN